MNAAHQVEHFQTRKEGDMRKRYAAIHDFFVSDYTMESLAWKTVIDVGCGPHGGVFMYRVWPRMIGIDPLWKEYARSGVIPPPYAMERVTGTFTDLGTDVKADAVFCTDALSYIPRPELFFMEVRRIMKPGGLLFIHCNLRGVKQLNEDHPHLHTALTFDEAIEMNFSRVKRQVLREDPFSGKAFMTYLATARNGKA